MQGRILLFFLGVRVLLLFFQHRPYGIFARTAYTWMGPFPDLGESWSRFQLRWAAYSFRWFVELALLFSALCFFAFKVPNAYSYTLFQLFLFALPLGLGMAFLAALGFLVRAAKAHYIGPNPVLPVLPESPEA